MRNLRHSLKGHSARASWGHRNGIQARRLIWGTEKKSENLGDAGRFSAGSYVATEADVAQRPYPPLPTPPPSVVLQGSNMVPPQGLCTFVPSAWSMPCSYQKPSCFLSSRAQLEGHLLLGALHILPGSNHHHHHHLPISFPYFILFIVAITFRNYSFVGTAFFIYFPFPLT